MEKLQHNTLIDNAIIAQNADNVNRKPKKARPNWQEHKARSVKISSKMLRLADFLEKSARAKLDRDESGEAQKDLIYSDYYRKRGYRMRNCSTFIKVDICPDCGRSIGSSISLCRDRVCPTCQWRLSAKQSVEMIHTLSYLGDLEYYTPCFLTLTVRNCKPVQLRATLDMMSEAFNRMNSGRKWKKLVEGTAKTTEITYNAVSHTFHPHFHLIMLIKDAPSLAEMQTFFNAEWKRCAHLNYIPITDIRYIEAKENTADESEIERYRKAILETFKYTIKDDNLQDMSLQEFRYYVEAINGRRLTAYTGNIKNARQQLDFTEELSESEDSYKTCPDCNGKMLEAIYEWSFQENSFKRFEDALQQRA